MNSVASQSDSSTHPATIGSNHGPRPLQHPQQPEQQVQQQQQNHHHHHHHSNPNPNQNPHPHPDHYHFSPAPIQHHHHQQPQQHHHQPQQHHHQPQQHQPQHHHHGHPHPPSLCSSPQVQAKIEDHPLTGSDSNQSPALVQCHPDSARDPMCEIKTEAGFHQSPSAHPDRINSHHHPISAFSHQRSSASVSSAPASAPPTSTSASPALSHPTLGATATHQHSSTPTYNPDQQTNTRPNTGSAHASPPTSTASPATHPSTTVPPSAPPPQVKRKFNATLEQKILILDWHHANGKKQTKTAAHFTSLEGWPTITQPLISNWLKDEDKIRANLKLATPDTKRLRIVRHPDVEQALSIWCNQAVAENIPLGYDPIKNKAREFAMGFGLDEAEFTKSSTCWIDRFLDRQASRTVKSHNSENLTSVAIEAERMRIRNASAYYLPQNIWTLDETSLYYNMPPDITIPPEKWKSEHRLLTLLLCLNSDGSERRPPLMIGKYQNPRCFRGKSAESLTFDYGWNSKACLTVELFIKWLTAWQKDLVRQNRKILLVLDNNPGHIVEMDLYPNIKFEFISSNMSIYIQPLDLGIMRAWKAHYRRLFLRRMLDPTESKPTNIYQIDQLQAMHLANTAWSTYLSQATIAACWRQTELLLPENYGADVLLRPEVAEHAAGVPDSELIKVIDQMVQLGLLDSRNRMPLEEYVNPACERIVTLQKFTDKEIIALVKNEESDPDDGERRDERKNSSDHLGAPLNLNAMPPTSNGLPRSQSTIRPTQPITHHRASLDNAQHINTLTHFQHPASANIMFHHAQHPMHLQSPAHSPSPLGYPGADQSVEAVKLMRNKDVWTVPQVLEALEEISKFSMLRRGDQEWKDVPQVMAKVAQTLRNEMANSVTAGSSFPNPVCSSRPQAAAQPLVTSHPHLHSNSHPHSIPHSHSTPHTPSPHLPQPQPHRHPPTSSHQHHQPLQAQPRQHHNSPMHPQSIPHPQQRPQSSQSQSHHSVSHSPSSQSSPNFSHGSNAHHQAATTHSQLSIDAITHPVDVNSN